MKSRMCIWSVAALALAISSAGCNCGHTSSKATDGGRPDSVIPDSGPGSLCLATGTSCQVSSGGTCCSGICGDGGACTEPKFCAGPATSCAVNTDCCSNNCISGTCSNQFCHDVAQGCFANTDCCTGSCDGGACVPLVVGGQGQSCKFEGQACAAAGDCCSTNCQGAICVLASSCHAMNDICYRGSDCCSATCSSTDGGAGFCIATAGSGAGGCAQGGLPCASGSNCCSRICDDPGSGATVCQSAGGCRLTGDACDSTRACCGGTGAGNVTCSGATATAAGLCDHGTACNAAGNICGAPVLPDGGKINAPQDCCDGHQSVCKLDSSGIPRCFGGASGSCPTGYTGTAPCCISQGSSCAFKDQCCNGMLCLQNGDAGFSCLPPTGSCQAQGGACTAVSDCCAGFTCNVAPGAPGGSCQPSSCPGVGQACAPGSGCCQGLLCRTSNYGDCTSATGCTCKPIFN